MKELLKEAYERFQKYEMDVDSEAPYDHINFMVRLRDCVKDDKNAESKEVLESDHFEMHGFGKTKIDDKCSKNCDNCANNEGNINWDSYFIKIAEAVALKSKDKSSKIGAVIVGPGHEIRSTGYNGLPRGMNDENPVKQKRPLKYKYFEHAERNAIYNAARFGATTDGCTMYCLWPPCSDCARAIVQSGIKKLVVKKSIIDCPARWHEDFVIATDILRESSVKFEVIGND